MMRKTIVLVFVMLLFGSGWAVADVLILEKGLYIDQVEIQQMNQDVIIFERRGKPFEIDPALVVSVTDVVPAGLVAISPEAIFSHKQDTAEAAATESPSHPDGHEFDTRTGKHEKHEAADKGEPDSSPMMESGYESSEKMIERINEKKYSFTIGFLNGGGALVGIDYQVLLGDSNVALQLGAGFVGYGAGLNFYFEPNMDSEYISLVFWNQGAGDVYMRYAGITYGYKAFGWLNGQIGLGTPFEVSEDMEAAFLDQGYEEIPSIMLLYTIGIYF